MEVYDATDDNKTVVRHIFEEVFNKRNPEAALKWFAPNFIEHVPGPGQGQGSEGMRRFLADIFFPAFPDARWTIEQQVAEGEWIVTRFIFEGTQIGVFAGQLPTGQPARMWGIVLDRIVGGRNIESWIINDAIRN